MVQFYTSKSHCGYMSFIEINPLALQLLRLWAGINTRRRCRRYVELTKGISLIQIRKELIGVGSLHGP